MQLTAPHRQALHLHCYRMLGSLHDADDALQETMLRAWRGVDRFQPNAPLAAWLYRIATNVCLRLIEQRQRRDAANVDSHLEPTPTGCSKAFPPKSSSPTRSRSNGRASASPLSPPCSCSPRSSAPS